MVHDIAAQSYQASLPIGAPVSTCLCWFFAVMPPSNSLSLYVLRRAGSMTMCHAVAPFLDDGFHESISCVSQPFGMPHYPHGCRLTTPARPVRRLRPSTPNGNLA